MYEQPVYYLFIILKHFLTGNCLGKNAVTYVKC